MWTTNGKEFENKNFLSKQSPEFEYNGKKYVRSIAMNSGFGDLWFHDLKKVPYVGNYKWIKVEPVTFKIENEEELLSGNAAELKLETEEAIISGIPFYPVNEDMSCWQNSLIRAFLNKIGRAHV